MPGYLARFKDSKELIGVVQAANVNELMMCLDEKYNPDKLQYKRLHTNICVFFRTETEMVDHEDEKDIPMHTHTDMEFSEYMHDSIDTDKNWRDLPKFSLTIQTQLLF